MDKVNQIRKEVKKTKEELRLEFAKQTLKDREEVLDECCEALAKYKDGDELGVRAIRSEKLKDNALKRVLEVCKDNGKRFSEIMFGNKEEREKIVKATELDKVNNDIEHINKLINIANYKIKNLSLDVRKKMVRDTINDMHSWNIFLKDISEMTKQ